MTSDEVERATTEDSAATNDVASRDAAVIDALSAPAPAAPRATRTDEVTALEAPDQETPTQALKTLGILCVIASVILMIPRQYVSAAIAFGLGVSLLLWRHRRLRREATRG